MADLFSFLDAVPDDDSTVGDAKQVVASKKRRAKTPLKDANDEEPSVKKPRLETPQNPIVLDDFETEARRVVAASAGLQGSVEEGARLELRHQVSPYLWLSTLYRPV